jgi:prophage maintenance system killer protein
MKKLTTNKTVIYQAKDGSIELNLDLKKEKLSANINQIAELFDRDKSVISRHIKNIYKTGELDEISTVAKIATVQKEGHREIIRNIEYYNLDMILSIGYRVDSKRATQFRIWATKVLKEYIVDGFAINKKHIAKNYQKFTQAINDIKILLPKNNEIDSANILDLVNNFAQTWLSLDAYDKDQLSAKGTTKRQISLDAKELEQGIATLKTDLIKKGETTEIFARERSKNSLEGIIGNVMQSFGGADLYATLEEKAAHLFYFIIKNHPFIDGNKRSGAFSFVWFLQKYNLLDISKISPQALTAITLLVAESNPKDKEKMTGLILLLLRK